MKSDKEVRDELAEKAATKISRTYVNGDFTKQLNEIPVIDQDIKHGFVLGYQAALRESPIVKELVEALKKLSYSHNMHDDPRCPPNKAAIALENYEREVNKNNSQLSEQSQESDRFYVAENILVEVEKQVWENKKDVADEQD